MDAKQNATLDLLGAAPSPGADLNVKSDPDAGSAAKAPRKPRATKPKATAEAAPPKPAKPRAKRGIAAEIAPLTAVAAANVATPAPLQEGPPRPVDPTPENLAVLMQHFRYQDYVSSQVTAKGPVVLPQAGRTMPGIGELVAGAAPADGAYARPLQNGQPALPALDEDRINADTQKAYRVIGTAHILMSAPEPNTLPPEEAVKMVAADIEETRAITTNRAYFLAINAMAESSHAHAQYKEELERQAPDLASAAKAHAEQGVDINERADPAFETGTLDTSERTENSIERGPVLEQEAAPMPPIAGSEQDVREGRMVDIILNNSRTMMEIPADKMTAGQAAAFANADVAAIGNIKDPGIHNMAMLMVKKNRETRPLYKAAFDQAHAAQQAIAQGKVAQTGITAEAQAKTAVADGLTQTQDAKLVRAVMDNSKAMTLASAAGMNRERATTLAADDIKALRAIKSESARHSASVFIDKSRAAQPEYKVAFDTLAPDLVPTSQAAQAAGQAAQAPSSAPDTDKTLAVPEAVAKQFDKVENRYYFKDKSPAFEDRGGKLATHGEHPQVIAALVAIASERGWTSATVKGGEAFRRQSWMELTRAGLQVAGYKPTEQDLIALAKVEPRNSLEQGPAQEQEKGPSLEKQAPAPAAAPAAPAKPITPENKQKAADFMRGKPEVMVKKYPDLASAYGQIDLARKVAEAQKAPQAVVDKWVEFNRQMIKERIERGEPAIEPQITAEGQAKLDAPTKGKEGADLGKPPRTKEAERER